ncbi:transmembrane protein 160 isoform X1 [Megalops cyprinoides]|uniref:transmembrane protein 160 isoform X1 n=1 Tax=Megalops cyprinoides TaxID=118141 RepID=UPI001865586F|nr:transmembrane protein 160 isoform X1 [Megalops cyprinoides]
MAALSWFACRQLPRITSQFGRYLRPAGALHPWAPVRRFAVTPRTRVGEKGPWGKTRMLEQPHLTELDKADALMLRKSHETGFLSWFRNGLLATGIGVIAFVQSDVGREAGYAFFILGGVCVSFGGASYVGNLFALRRTMLLSLPLALMHSLVVTSIALFWLCAVSLYIGRLEVEIIHDEDEEGEDGGECEECGGRREGRHPEDKGQEK